MLELHQFPRNAGLPNPSPFCMKLETYLRMAQIPYTVKTVFDPRKAPKGKLPYIVEDGGESMADSRIIVEYLERTGSAPLDAALSPRDKALAHLLTAVFEDNLYWIGVWSRWVDDDGWALVKDTYFRSIPGPVRPLVAAVLRRKTRASTEAQGIGRHRKDEIYQFAGRTLAEVSTYLGDRPYFLGDEPTTIDATAFGVLANMMWGPSPAAMRTQAGAHANLEGYCGRIKDRYFADMPEFTAGP